MAEIIVVRARMNGTFHGHQLMGSSIKTLKDRRQSVPGKYRLRVLNTDVSSSD